jgi:hypothetical protein
MSSTTGFLDWPPAYLPLAARVYPERATLADTAFDRWTAGILSSLRLPKVVRGRGRGTEAGT